MNKRRKHPKKNTIRDFIFHIWIHLATGRRKEGEGCARKKKRDCLAPRRGEVPRYIKTMESVKQTDRRQPACFDLSGRLSLAISVLALNYDEVSQVGSISRATNRKKTHMTCLCSAWKRIDGWPLFTRRPVRSAREYTPVIGIGIAPQTLLSAGFREYEPQPQRINYVSSVIRLVLVHTESECRCLRSIFASLRNGDRFAI